MNGNPSVTHAELQTTAVAAPMVCATTSIRRWRTRKTASEIEKPKNKNYGNPHKRMKTHVSQKTTTHAQFALEYTKNACTLRRMRTLQKLDSPRTAPMHGSALSTVVPRMSDCARSAHAWAGVRLDGDQGTPRRARTRRTAPGLRPDCARTAPVRTGVRPSLV